MPPKDTKQTGIKSIARKDFIQAGSVDKTHGTKGELRISLTTDKSFKEWAFLEIQGKPVPFYIQSLQPTFDDGALLKLRDINSVEKASEFVGRTLRWSFHPFYHEPAELDDMIRTQGVEEVDSRTTPIWQIKIFKRVGVAGKQNQ